ncbi:MAG TPA: TRAP transporter small permease [Noviherbaspirillum sp.]|jgi:TRAP-type C4-dicarboxylate transport system permease small subunit|uniref:TRAP transporter small permease n=1 Tax=Noviherbaspirillum sp. TaxID=1926288 RepID=UPI002DDCEBA6|nr:TRAP transporter small permease [Noviherbaspirillum sp.]HEV2612489.1 TRAP transporter small permease [Noviherbaspirillum sp.]
MNALLPRAERFVEWLMGLALAIMVVLVFGNVVLRYGFNSGIAWAEEVSRLMFVWLIFLGAILALRQHAHLGVEMVQAKLPARARRACAVVSHLLMLYGLWLFLSGSWTQTVIGLNTYSTVLRYPTAFMASAGLICAASMMLIVATNLWRIVRKDPKAMVPGDPHQAAPIAAEGVSE